MRHFHCDFETASEADIDVGTDNYARHPSTRVLMLSYAFNDGEVMQWFPEDGPLPANVRRALADPTVDCIAHNAPFERAIFKHVLGIDVPNKRWICTMAMAASLALPLGLDRLCVVLRLPQDSAKLKVGKKLIRLFCGPNKPTKKNPQPWNDKTTHPQEWDEFCLYGRQDVVAERHAFKVMSRYIVDLPRMRELWTMGQEINERGVPVDMEIVEGAIHLAAVAKAEFRNKMKELSGLENPESPSQVLAWVRERGYPYNNLRKTRIEAALEFDAALMTQDCINFLRLRLASAKTSLKKFDAFVRATADDGRVRYMFQFRGAGRTGRYGGRLVQLQNLARPAKACEKHLALIREMIRERDYESLCAFFDNPFDPLVSCIRACIAPAAGRVFRVADLSAIELCVLAWLTKCEFWLEVLRKGRDPYKSFGVHFLNKAYEEISKKERNECKPGALGAGYRLGGGFLSKDKNGDPVKTGLWGYAASLGVALTKEQAKIAVDVYREISPEVVDSWYAIEQACVETVKDKKTRHVLGLVIDVKPPFLRIRLPSGRYLHYCRPKIEKRRFQVATDEVVTWVVDPKTGEKVKHIEEVPKYSEAWNLTYEGEDQSSGAWVRIATHGGKLIENIVQAIALDVLNHGMELALARGYDVILHVHDEVGTEADSRNTEHTLEGLYDCLTTRPDWAPDLPLGAAGYEATFYKKD